MLTELVELIESGPLDLELQRRTAMAAGQRHQQGIEQDGRVTLGFDLLRQFVPAFKNRTRGASSAAAKIYSKWCIRQIV
jgi:hypothetical protein